MESMDLMACCLERERKASEASWGLLSIHMGGGRSVQTENIGKEQGEEEGMEKEDRGSAGGGRELSLGKSRSVLDMTTLLCLK